MSNDKLSKILLVSIIFLIFLLVAKFVKEIKLGFIEKFIIYYYFYFLLVLFSLISVFIYLNFKNIRKEFLKIKSKTWTYFLIIFILALILRGWIIPHTFEVINDEYFHIDKAKNLAEQQINAHCIFSLGGKCRVYEADHWPPGYHLILAAAFRIFGASPKAAFNLNALIGSLSVMLVFFIVYLLLKKENIALWGALLFTFIPVHLKLSGTATLEVMSLFFVLLTLLFLLIYFKNQSKSILILASLVLAYTVQIRLENILFVFLFGLMFIMFDKKLKEKIKSSNFTGLLLLMLILLIPCFLQIRYSGSLKVPGWNDSLAEHIIHFSKNIKDNTLFWFKSYAYPLLYSLLSIVGLIFMVQKKEKRKIAILFSIWFLAFFIFYTSYSFGSFIHFGDSWRFTDNLYVPLIIFASFGIESIVGLAKNKSTQKIIKLALIVFILLIPYSFANFINLDTPQKEESKFIFSLENKIGDNCLVIVHNPVEFITTINKNAISPFLIDRYDVFDYSNCVFYYFDLFHDEEMSTRVTNNYKLVPYINFTEKVRGRQYYLYRVLKK